MKRKRYTEEKIISIEPASLLLQWRSDLEADGYSSSMFVPVTLRLLA